MTADATPAAAATADYAFSNSVEQARQQLGALEAYLDPITTACLEDLGIQPGMRCLELGPGGGSIAHWLAERVGPTGRVVAVDRDPTQLAPTANMEVHQHDLHHGLPVAGPFNMIHARLVLVHLLNRRSLLRQLVDALTPGGWIVLGEFSGHPLTVLSADSQRDAAVFSKVIDTFRDLLVQQYGADTAWAHQVFAAMRQEGLRQMKMVEHAESWTGGEAGSQLHVANIRQKHHQLLDAGLTDAELEYFLNLMADPACSSRSWQFVCTRGQKPVTT